MNRIQWAPELLQHPEVLLFQPPAGSSKENTLQGMLFLPVNTF